MQQILEDSKFLEILEEIAFAKDQTADQAKKEAAEYLKELYCEKQPVVNAIVLQGLQYVLNRAYDEHIDIIPSQIRELGKLMRRHSVAFVMTHKTYIDMIVLGIVLSKHGLPVPHTFAGINMSFMGVGELGRKAGVIFIRRSFKDNLVYKATLRHYISHLVKEKEHFMWAIEGTRSRTGKLVWPKMGILKYIVEAEKNAEEEVKYVPVSTVYDLIPDVREMTEEGRGKSKNPESLLWFVNYLKNMDGNFGRISLRFGEPVVRAADQTASIPLEKDTLSTKQYTLPRFAFELVHRINQITPVTSSSLICTILMSKFAATKPSLENDLVSLMEFIESHRPDALVDRGKAVNESVQSALNILRQANLIQKLGDGLKAKYSIVSRNYLSVAYYANMAVHHLYHMAFIELALLKVSSEKSEGRIDAFWSETIQLRDFFKFEFFYSRKSEFCDEIERDLDFLDSKWQSILGGTSTGIEALLKRQNILVSQVVLITYIEAYKVVGQALETLDPVDDYDEESLLNTCLFIGEEMHWHGKIHRVESVSKPFIINGIRLAKNRNLISSKTKIKIKEIKAFNAQLDEYAERIRTLQTFVSAGASIQRKSLVPLEKNIVPGSKSESVATDISVYESGPHIAAFFDLDRTLIKGFSAKDFFQTRLMSGKMKPQELAAQFSGVMVYAMGNKNFAGLAATGANGVKGVREKVFVELGEEVYLKSLADAIYPESRALVSAHLAKGHTVAILSAATPYQVNPIARDLGIEHVLCTRMEVVNGKFTGKIIEPPCWGEGKSQAAKNLAEDLKLDLSQSFFYTDSAEDLPLLEIVGHPRPINPDSKLSALAFENDWPIKRFNEEIQPGMSNIIRTGLTIGSFIPAAISGLVSGTLSGSVRDGVNNMTSVIGDLGTKMAGIKMAVKGEEYLWSHRPAVFIFNHQSNADFFIIAKMLKKDAVAIAKKELKSSPIGPLLTAAGVIFIDRSNREKAIEEMKPAVDALKSGLSVAIAPEGTRSYNYSLGAFKKGAFHLALQAEVPIVPIVIKNAHDVMPRGRSLVRPSVVNVVVLKPISVKDWKRESLSEHIGEVRRMYLNQLQQEEMDLVDG